MRVTSVNTSRLYNLMRRLEYYFSRPFRSLVKLERKLGRAACVANKTRSSTPPADALLVHPVDLHAVFRSVVVVYSYLRDGQLRLLHLPTSIKIASEPCCTRPSISRTILFLSLRHVSQQTRSILRMHDEDFMFVLGRIAAFYLRRFGEIIPEGDP